jgi:hypothetical protein
MLLKHYSPDLWSGARHVALSDNLVVGDSRFDGICPLLKVTCLRCPPAALAVPACAVGRFGGTTWLLPGAFFAIGTSPGGMLKTIGTAAIFLPLLR